MFPFWIEFEPATLVELTTGVIVGITLFITSGILRGNRI